MKLSQEHSILSSPQVHGDILYGLLIGIAGILSLIISIISCICCSKRGSKDRRLSSYSSVKDTVQLEDLLSKPVLADPESVFSEPSINYNRTPSVSNKSPSADSDLVPRNISCSDNDSDHFLFPNSPNTKSDPDKLPLTSLPSTSQFSKREAVSVKQKNSPKGSRKIKRDMKKAVSEEALVCEYTPDDNLSRPKSPTAVENAPSYIPPNSQKNQIEASQFLKQASGTTSSLATVIDLAHDEKETENKLHMEESSSKENQALKNVNSERDMPQPKKLDGTKSGHSKMITGQNNGSSPSQSLSSAQPNAPEYDKETENVDAACESTVLSNETKQSAGDRIKLPQTPDLNNIIPYTCTGSTRLRNSREKNLTICVPNQVQSILTPGRCSFSHEAGHIANGSSKIMSPLINMSPVQERRLHTQGSDSTSPVISSSPSESPKVFQNFRRTVPAVDLPCSENDTSIKVNDTQRFCQNPSLEQKKENVPLRSATSVNEASSSNFQTHIIPARVVVSDNVLKSKDVVPLRRSFSDETPQTSLTTRNVKTFSVNLQIDFHFENTECTQPTVEKAPSKSPRNIQNNKGTVNKSIPQSNMDRINAANNSVMLNLGKNSQSSANNDAGMIEQNHKRQILEKAFAEKSIVELLDSQMSASRKRQSEPIIFSKTFSEMNSMILREINTQTARKMQRRERNSGKRPARNRRSYAAGEKVQLHSTWRKENKTTESKAVENTIGPFEGIETKRPRFVSSEDLKAIQSSTIESHVPDSNAEDSKEVISLDQDRHAPNIFIEEKELHTTKRNYKGVKLSTDTERDKLSSAEIHPKEEYRRTKKKSIRRWKTIQAGICKELLVVSMRELSRSDPVIFKLSESSGIGLSSPKPNICHGSLDQCISDYPSTLVENIIKQKRRAKSPVPKPRPRPKPRAGQAANIFAQTQSLARKTEVPKAKPRFSKSMEKLNIDSEGKKNSGSVCLEQKLPTIESTDFKIPPCIEGVKSDTRNDPLPDPVAKGDTFPTQKSKGDQSQATQGLVEQGQKGANPDGGCSLKEENVRDKESNEKKAVPVIEVSDDSDYDNPWDSLDGAVQRASIRYNRRPSRIAAGEDTKTLLLQSAEDLGRLLEQAEKRRQLRQTAAKSSCPGERDLLSPDREPTTSVLFTRFSPFRHTVKGLVSKPSSETSKSNQNLGQDFPSPRSGKYFKKGEMASRSQSLMKRHPQNQNTSLEDELIALRGRKPKNFSPPSRPKSLSVIEAAKAMSPETKKRKN